MLSATNDSLPTYCINIGFGIRRKFSMLGQIDYLWIVEWPVVPCTAPAVKKVDAKIVLIYECSNINIAGQIFLN